ncbi:LysR family transcriptional regulator substrate-binding protein [Streptomyces sp. NPDC096153]|uniref:LysR family transcriptional regulator substrate-binding protein n=1 Tax=Streptomyces sp. NPDC096153 TaxID=3155548 RepID=UPI00331DAE97
MHRERSLLLIPRDGELATRTRATWEVAGLPLCLFSPRMQDRRILDRNLADAGVRADASTETDTVSALCAHLATRRWSSVIAHVWLGLFGVPRGCVWCPWSAPPATIPWGLVLADRDRVSACCARSSTWPTGWTWRANRTRCCAATWCRAPPPTGPYTPR